MKLLVIGCGSIGRRHARNLQELGVNNLLLYDRDHRRADSLAWELRVKSTLTLEHTFDEGPDAALICVPTSLHLPLAKQALAHDCHLFIEKPISHSTDGVEDFLEEAAIRKRLVLVGYHFRYDPLIKTVRAWLASERAGRVLSARFHFGSHLPSRHPGEDYREGYGARRGLGGGVILDAIHELDLALWLFGQPETIYCSGGKYTDWNIDVEDVAEILLSYADKVVSIHLDFVQRPPQRSIEISGLYGRIHADLFARTLLHINSVSQARESVNVNFPIDEIYISEMRHFLDCIEGTAKPHTSGWMAAQSLFLAEEAKKSMMRHLPISLNESTAGVQCL